MYIKGDRRQATGDRKNVLRLTPDARRLSLYKNILKDMYITEILQYLLWPVLIAVTWFAIRFALARFERRFPEKE